MKFALDPGNVPLRTWEALYRGAAATMHDSCWDRIATCATSVTRIVARGEPVYGINTGFGKLANVRKLKIVFLGDSNNMSYSGLLLSGMMGLHFVLACPGGYDPDAELLRRAKELAGHSGGQLDVVHDPRLLLGWFND